MAVEIAHMVDVVQLVRASDCGSECRGFESHPPPSKKQAEILYAKGFRFSLYRQKCSRKHTGNVRNFKLQYFF